MNKFFAIVILLLISGVADAGQKLKHCNYPHEGCIGWNGQKQEDSPQKQAGQHQTAHAWKEIVSYAGNAEVKPLAQGACFSDYNDNNGAMMVPRGESSSGADSYCKDYEDKKGATWRVVLDKQTNVRKVIRLSDNAQVRFDSLGRVAGDTTNTKFSSTQEAKREKSEPTKSAEGQGQQINPADVAKKALGTIFKGF